MTCSLNGTKPLPESMLTYTPKNKLPWKFNTLRPRQHGRHFPDDTFKRIFLNENVWISLKLSLNYVPKGPINNIPALVQIMAWRRPGDKLLSEPMMVRLPTHICVTRPQSVNQNTNFSSNELYLTISPANFGHVIQTSMCWISCQQKCYFGECAALYWAFNTMRPRQNGCHFADDIFKCIFLNENYFISIQISLKYVPSGPIIMQPLVQTMAWCRTGDKPLSEPKVA